MYDNKIEMIIRKDLLTWQKPFRVLIVLPTFNVNKYLSFTPGYSFVNSHPEIGISNNEHQVVSFATINYPVAKNLTITDRNMFFHRFRKHTDDLSFYRNRLGIIHTTSFFEKHASMFLYDEIYLSLNGDRLTRDRVIVGGGIKLFKWLTPQVMYMYQWDNGDGKRHLGLLVFTVPLKKFGVFNSKKQITEKKV